MNNRDGGNIADLIAENNKLQVKLNNAKIFIKEVAENLDSIIEREGFMTIGMPSIHQISSKIKESIQEDFE